MIEIQIDKANVPKTCLEIGQECLKIFILFCKCELDYTFVNYMEYLEVKKEVSYAQKGFPHLKKT